MSHEMIRTHVVIPKDLLEEVDKLVGSRRRSEFLTAAVAEKVARLKLRQAAHKLGGSLEHTDIPGWETSESSADWVRNLRRESEERRQQDATGR